MFRKFVIAIDGPAGSGKSTSAKLVAEKLGFLYIDTGAMYRAVTYLALKQKISGNPQSVVDLTNSAEINLEFKSGKTFVTLNGEDVTEEIRSVEVNSEVSNISRIEGVRKSLVEKQRKMASDGKGVVMEGRDIGSVVFPDADVKIFLTASIEQRAERRAKEYKEKGQDVPVKNIAENLNYRDSIDSSRDVSPLIQSPDAFVIDTTKVTIEEQVDLILKKVKEAAEQKGIDVPI